MTELSPEERDLLETYGPAATHSEHSRGQVITYQLDGLRSTGEILWVAAPSEQGGVQLPLRYVVAPDAEGRFIDVVFPADVLQAE